MYRWMAFHPMTAPTFWVAYTCASVRHAAWGMPYDEHRRMMRLVYGM